MEPNPEWATPAFRVRSLLTGIPGPYNGSLTRTYSGLPPGPFTGTSGTPPEQMIHINRQGSSLPITNLSILSQVPRTSTFSLLAPLMFREAGTQTEVPLSNRLSYQTRVKLMLGVVLSAVGVVILIFVMKCKFKIGFQLNMCYYM